MTSTGPRCTPDLKIYADCTNLRAKPLVGGVLGRDERSLSPDRGDGRPGHPGLPPEPTAGRTRPRPLVKQIIASTADDLGLPGTSRARPDRRLPRRSGGRVHPGRAPRPARDAQVLLERRPAARHAARWGRRRRWPRPSPTTGRPPPPWDCPPGPSAGARHPDRAPSPWATPDRFHDFYDAEFKVPKGRARPVTASVGRLPAAGNVGGLLGNVDVILFDPRPNLADYAVPQGAGNVADAQVRYPAAGTWTALSSRPLGRRGRWGLPLPGQPSPQARWGRSPRPRSPSPPGRRHGVVVSGHPGLAPGDEGRVPRRQPGAGDPAFTRVTATL